MIHLYIFKGLRMCLYMIISLLVDKIADTKLQQRRTMYTISIDIKINSVPKLSQISGKDCQIQFSAQYTWIDQTFSHSSHIFLEKRPLKESMFLSKEDETIDNNLSQSWYCFHVFSDFFPDIIWFVLCNIVVYIH